MKRFACALLALLLTLSLAACGGSGGDGPDNAPPSGGQTEDGRTEVLTVAVTKDENDLAPFTYVSSTGLTVNRLVYDTLLTTDLDNDLIPWMVEADYTVEDNRVFTFRLLPGQHFHNGEAVDAEAVAFSFTYPATQSRANLRSICAAIESIEVLDELTVRFTLAKGDVNFLRDAFAEMRIICPSDYEGVEDATTVTNPSGSGMYRLAEYRTGEYYVLQAVEDYFKGRPAVDTLRMPIIADATAVQQALLSGEIAASTGTIGGEMVEVFEARPELTLFSNADFAPTIVNMNCGRYPFTEPDFRRAIACAVDVEGICRMLYGDYALPGTPGAIRSDLPYAIDARYTYDPQRAAALLDGLGFTETNGVRLDGHGDPLSFTIITYAGNAVRSRICELMREQLREVGIELEISSLDMDTADAYIWPDFDVAKGRDYDMSTWGWGTSAGNSYTYLISLCAGDYDLGGYNVCGYQSDRFDRLVAETEVNSAEDMEALLEQLQQVVAEEVPLLTIGFADKLQVCNTALYDGWKAGLGTNVVNIHSFLP